MSHICPRDGCTRTVGDAYLMCPGDWRRVPSYLQRAVYVAYGRGAGLGSEALAAAQDAAIAAVNGKAATTKEKQP
jgi:hypothetical protein